MYSGDALLEPTRVTGLLGDAASLIRDLGFEFTSVGLGKCTGFLPLSVLSANQHGTQLGLIMGLVADFVGGLAFASLLPEEPILGIHEVTPEQSMCLWTLESHLKFLRPASDDVSFECVLDASLVDSAPATYAAGKPIVADATVHITDSYGALVAEGTFKYFARQKSRVQPSADPARPNVMFDHFMKSSARLIAALRALETESDSPLFHDPFARTMAGKQGLLMAQRFLESVPELQSLVSARTHQADLFLRSADFAQIVFVGVGFDMRMHRSDFPKARVFELDLADMLVERKRLKQALAIQESDVLSAPCNLLTDGIAAALKPLGFDASLPTAFIFEGCSMYFRADENTRILGQLRELLLGNSDSKIWLDVVAEEILGQDVDAGVETFMRGMARIGEPFVFGLPLESNFFSDLGLRIASLKDATPYAQNFGTSLFECYRFYSLS